MSRTQNKISIVLPWYRLKSELSLLMSFLSRWEDTVYGSEPNLLPSWPFLGSQSSPLPCCRFLIWGKFSSIHKHHPTRQWPATTGDFITWRALAMSEEFLVVTIWGRCFWHLDKKGQGCCTASYRAHTAAPQRPEQPHGLQCWARELPLCNGVSWVLGFRHLSKLSTVFNNHLKNYLSSLYHL